MSITESNIRRKLLNYKNNPLKLSYHNKQNMYFLGWLWSDGYIKKPNRISLEIVTKDANDIQNVIPKYFNQYTRERKNRQPQTQFIACREDLVDWLYNHGYQDKQTPSDEILNSKLLYQWFRGVVDGDGCWYFNKKWQTRQFHLSSKMNQDWSYAISILDNIGCNYKVKLKSQKNNTQHYSMILMCEKQSLIKLHNYLYPKGFIFGLRRKYLKSLECIS